ncbi:MAG: succinate dehydrogenase, cytochrome b556 subunit [Gammaproteobacteria bacterium]|nr:succinate dehydrogenase, cytochrome b556 subunit [Gammaproteobacteria bacterium]
MVTQKKPPVFLNLLKIKLPLQGILSIFHRISGVILFLFIPFFIYFFERSLQGEAGFNEVVSMLDSTTVKLFIALTFWGLSHHLFAGIRYLLLDFDVAIDKKASRLSAQIVFILGFVIFLFTLGALF